MIPMFFSCNKLKLSFFALSFLLADLIIKCVFIGGDYFDFMKQTKIGSKSMAWMKLLDTVLKKREENNTHKHTNTTTRTTTRSCCCCCSSHTTHEKCNLVPVYATAVAQINGFYDETHMNGQFELNENSRVKQSIVICHMHTLVSFFYLIIGLCKIVSITKQLMLV